MAKTFARTRAKVGLLAECKGCWSTFAGWNLPDYGGHPSRGLPPVAHASGKRERRVVDPRLASWNRLAVWLKVVASIKVGALTI